VKSLFRKTTVITAMLMGSLLLAALALADQPTGVNSVTVVKSERANLSQAPQSTQAAAGNVTELSITATAITTGWQGFFGNITGSITLEDASGNVFYNWSGLGSISGEVYASRDNAVTWSTVNCSNSTTISNENAFLGKASSDPDSVTNTFSATSHPSFLVGTINITANSCPSTNAFSGGSQVSNRFYQVLLQDGDGDVIYTTLIDQDQVGFDSKQYDFELLVGENGNATSQATTTYYFYIELS